MNKLNFNNKSFLLLLVAVSICFVWIIQPFLIAIFWACILAIAFWPVHQWILKKIPNWPTFASLSSVTVCTVLLVLPLIALTMFLVQELLAWYHDFNISSINLLEIINNALTNYPFTVKLAHLFDLNSAEDIQLMLINSMSSVGSFVTSQAISLSQNALSVGTQVVIVIYLLFFLFRDGISLIDGARKVIPIDKIYIEQLVDNFNTVVLATVKGTLLIAILQGFLGGLMLYCFGIPNAILWSVSMAVLALLPIVGASLVWGPIAIYFLYVGQTFEGVTIIVIGTALIGTLDNLLRPLLVGKGTKLPDYAVLLTTIGGMYLFGFVGFVLGPVVAALFVSVWTFFGELQSLQERTQHRKHRVLIKRNLRRNNKY